MKKRLFVIACLSACSVFAAPIIRKGGDVVHLSTGETVKVAYYKKIEVDAAMHKAAGHHVFVIFQSSTGTLIGMDSKTSAGGRVETTIKAVHGVDRIRFDTDPEFRHHGLPVPMTVEINGKSMKFLMEPDNSGENDKRMRVKLGSDVAKLSPEFTSAAKELFRLGHAGYSPDIGTGWASLLTIFDPAEVAVAGAEVVSQSPMTPADQKMIGSLLHQ